MAIKSKSKRYNSVKSALKEPRTALPFHGPHVELDAISKNIGTVGEQVCRDIDITLRLIHFPWSSQKIPNLTVFTRARGTARSGCVRFDRRNHMKEKECSKEDEKIIDISDRWEHIGLGKSVVPCQGLKIWNCYGICSRVDLPRDLNLNLFTCFTCVSWRTVDCFTIISQDSKLGCIWPPPFQAYHNRSHHARSVQVDTVTDRRS